MATVAASTNPNIEKIGSIKVYSSSSPTADEKKGLLFGGYAYSADVQANNGDGYTISIRVISKDGTYKISSSDLNVTKKGAKNIIVGNFTFYDFYLITYSIDKEVENSILTLTYKDKSIFMDKVYIGLFSHHYGNSLSSTGNIVQNPDILNGEESTATFKYKCNDTKYGIKNAYLLRYLNRVQTLNASNSLKQKYALTTLPDYLSSDSFSSKYNYNLDGVNGGYIILGREEINEELCTLPEISYCFKDLTSALAYAEIPGIINFNLGKDNDIYRILRRKYFGSLRSVLDQWGNDLGFKFYYQPKIDFLIKDYSDANSQPTKKIIPEGVKLINLVSSSQTLKNLNALFNPNDPKYNSSLQKVIGSVSETATLEGTRKSNVVTPIRRSMRSFNSSSSYLKFKNTGVLGLNFLSSFYGNSPSSEATIVGGTLSIYDQELRDIYHLSKQNYTALGINPSEAIILSPSIIKSSLDFLQTFSPSFSPSFNSYSSEILSDYTILLAVHDESKHSLIKEWEKAIMSEYYGKYYMLGNRSNESLFCNGFTNYSIEYETVPPSQSYIANELPFSKLLYGQFGNNNSSLPSYGTAKYNPIFTVDNPFDYRNETNYRNFSESIASFQENKSLTIINLNDNPKAKMALFNCLTIGGYKSILNFIATKNVSLIVAKNFNETSSKIIDINLSTVPIVENLSTVVVGQAVKTTTDNANKAKCPKTICEQTLFDTVCGETSTNDAVNQSDTGFLSRNARVVTISYINSSNSISTCNLILPVESNYRYAETKHLNSTVTFAGSSYILGHPPEFSDYNGNVLSHEIIDNTVPEILTQSTSANGVIDKVITFDDNGKNTLVLSAYDYHNRVDKNLNNSILIPYEQKKISLTSTYIPSPLVDFVFTSPVLNSMNFSFNESGFNITLDFASRPKQPKQRDALFLTERFLKKL